MSQILNYLNSHTQETKRIIGINHEQLTQLIKNAQQLDEQKKEKINKTKKLLIKKGGGRKKKLTSEDEIILTLYYLHHFPTFQVLGINFGVSESTAHEIFHYWLNILRELLPASLLEQVKKNENEYLWVREILTELELIVDTTEQSIERPSANEKQKNTYSGKKKDYTFKNQVITNPKGNEIVLVKVGERGPESDINIWRKEVKNFDKQQKFIGDKAYQGESRIITPQKKPNKKEMPSEIKLENRQKAKKRIFIEHIIRLIKIFSIARERFRLAKNNYEKIILTVCGLVRLRIGSFILV